MKMRDTLEEYRFRQKVINFLKGKALDVWPFERCGKGCLDLLVVPRNSVQPMFFIEVKGRTGWELTAQQKNFIDRYTARNIECFEITPDIKDWEKVLEKRL